MSGHGAEAKLGVVDSRFTDSVAGRVVGRRVRGDQHTTPAPPVVGLSIGLDEARVGLGETSVHDRWARDEWERSERLVERQG